MKKVIIAVLVMAALFASACSVTVSADSASPASSAASASGSASVQKISMDDAKKMMDKGGVTIVDVRRADEYAAGHIPNAINVPNESITAGTMPDALPDKDATLLVYCRTGHRSADASAKLAQTGYTHVYDIGGIVDWTGETVQ